MRSNRKVNGKISDFFDQSLTQWEKFVNFSRKKSRFLMESFSTLQGVPARSQKSVQSSCSSICPCIYLHLFFTCEVDTGTGQSTGVG